MQRRTLSVALGTAVAFRAGTGTQAGRASRRRLPSSERARWTASVAASAASAASAAAAVAPATQQHASYSSYVAPPSNQDLDPNGVDARLFEEEATDEYQHTRDSLQLLTDLLPATAGDSQGAAAAAPSATASSAAFRPGDVLVKLIRDNDLARANQLLAELRNLHTDLGMPSIEYIRAALRSLSSKDPKTCASESALTWLRLAPSVRHLQAQDVLRANPGYYQGIHHHDMLRLELGPRKGVQDPVRAAANQMMQNCLALLTQRGVSPPALAHLQEALTISLSRGYSGSRDEMAIVVLASHLSTNTRQSSHPDNPLIRLWTDIVTAAVQGSAIRPSVDESDVGEVDETLYHGLRSRLRGFLNLIVRTAALRGSASLVDAVGLVHAYESAVVKGKARSKVAADPFLYTTLTAFTRACLVSETDKALQSSADEATTRTLSTAKSVFETRWQNAQDVAAYMAAGRQPATRVPSKALRQDNDQPLTLTSCKAQRTELVKYVDQLREAWTQPHSTGMPIQVRKEVTSHLVAQIHVLSNHLMHLGTSGSSETSPASENRMQAFFAPLDDALSKLGRSFPPVLMTARVRSLCDAGRYDDALRLWANVFGTDARAGISAHFLAMAMMDPATLKEERARSGIASSRALPSADIPEAVGRLVTMRPATAAVYRPLSAAGAVQGLRIAIAACEWDPDQLSRLYKLWLAQITEVDHDAAEPTDGWDGVRGGGGGARAKFVPKRLRPHIVEKNEEILALFEVFFRAFIHQQAGAVRAKGPQLSITTRQRAIHRAHRLTKPLRKRFKAEVAERTMRAQIPSWARHADASLRARLVRILGDVRLVRGLGRMRVEVWNELLRALGREGRDGWEARTVVLARAMGMVPGEQRERVPSVEAGSAGKETGTGTSTAPEANDEDANAKEDKAATTPSEPRRPKMTLLDIVGPPPPANRHSFAALLRGLDSIPVGLPIGQYGRRGSARVPSSPAWIAGAKGIVRGWRDVHPSSVRGSDARGSVRGQGGDEEHEEEEEEDGLEDDLVDPADVGHLAAVSEARRPSVDQQTGSA